MNPLPLGLYIHIPWCIRKCPYCDFNSHARKTELPESRYIEALLLDLQRDLQFFAINRPIRHIFIGGGTPSLLTPEALDRLLNGIYQQTGFEKNIEITLEANPGTFESEKFAEFRALGINRLSIGIQSFNDQCLQRLGRVHCGREARRAVEIAHQAGFENFNLDLMFGLPEAAPGTSLQDIRMALALQPRHLSFYQLTLEPNTWFHKQPPHLPNPDAIADEQLQCQRYLQEQGYPQYEISAYARPGFHCRHNLNYWQFGDYLAIGAGAHGKISRHLPDRIERYSKPKSPEHYMQTILQNQTDIPRTPIAKAELPLEFVMNHLRLRSGFTQTDYQRRTGLAFDSLQPTLQICLERGLLKREQDRYFCSEKGWYFLDSLLEQFIP